MPNVLSSPVANHVLQRVRDGATVDTALVSTALEAALELKPAEAQSLVHDLLTTSKDMTPAAREALEAFVAAAATPTTKPSTLTGILAGWIGRSPPPRERDPGARVDAGIVTANMLLSRSPKEVLAAALEGIDPVLAQTVHHDSRYSVGLTGLAALFPALASALSTFEAAHEPGESLMVAALKELPPPRALSAIAGELKGGAPLDQKNALELLRAATRERVGDGVLKGVLHAATKAGTATEAGAAFLNGFLHSNADTLDGRYYSAHVAVSDARNPFEAFDNAVADVDPKLAERGHTELLLSGDYPGMDAAFDEILRLTRDLAVENWTARARDVVAATLQPSSARSD